MKTIACASVDMDGIDCYYQIHGLGSSSEELQNVIFQRGIERFSELFGRLNIRSTFFVVGKDVSAKKIDNRNKLKVLAQNGHELANHSYSHDYSMMKDTVREIESDIKKAHDILFALRGTPPAGFRAPGYFMNEKGLRICRKLGYRYDSSLLPSPLYYSAKACVLANMAIRGRNSRSVLTKMADTFGPTLPYRRKEQQSISASDHSSRKAKEIWEIPMTVSPHFRLPIIGTSILLSPTWLRQRWLKLLSSYSFINFELHAIDLCDIVLDRLPRELSRYQRELRIPLTERTNILYEFLAQLKGNFEFMPLETACDVF